MKLSATSGPARTDGSDEVLDDRTVASDGDRTPDDATVTVRVQLRPRRSAARRCLAVLAEIAGQHDTVAFALEGISSDDRVVRLTLGVHLGPRAEVAKFGAEAQAAYAFVNALFESLYDHMPVYTAQPSEADRRAARTMLAAGDALSSSAGGGAPVPADLAGTAAVRDHLSTVA
ncbi:hypothetical protein GB931_16665 [Modestobacter sp. I12A-02628]|uniref:Uncharacterized protein n=1 Tax=Goekera deserti TaxID=2497753 RepID=A0A7K3WCT3_9ACTN|nr:hypothetical protein [Goekera deserti]MPQ99518.1 hypothetical protein [Goekera deserti]NDI49005.1 hypothetical protein [Goekera deserti]NEL54204.1 hypothetical protein [Goekera deserti]